MRAIALKSRNFCNPWNELEIFDIIMEYNRQFHRSTRDTSSKFESITILIENNLAYPFFSLRTGIDQNKTFLHVYGYPTYYTVHLYDTGPYLHTRINNRWQAEPWWRASIWRSHRKVVIKQCSYHNNIIDIQNRLPYSKVVFPAIVVLFSCLMEVNHGVRTDPNYPFR